MAAAFTAAVLSLLLIACSNGGAASSALTDDALIVHRFRAGSVPPGIHRSFTLTITSTEVHVQVDSYGDVLADVTRPLTPDVWQLLIETAPSIGDLTDQGSRDYVGGTGRSITITDSGETLVDLEFDVCSSDGNDADRIEEVLQPVIDGLGDWEELTV